MRETKGLDVGGDGSKLTEIQVQERTWPKPRDFRISYEILQKFGYTKNCGGCEARSLGMEHRSHTQECRMRLKSKMKEDTKMQQTMQTKHNERIRREMHDEFVEQTQQDPQKAEMQEAKF